jgi:cystathionine beta-synthase
LRDVIGRSLEQKSVVVVAPDDKLLVAYSRMKLYDVSQLPVMDGERIIGIVDESDLLYAVHDDSSAFQRTVQSIMSAKLETVQVNAPIDSLMPLFERGLVVIVCEGTKFLGLITQIDMLNYLRRRVS